MMLRETDHNECLFKVDFGVPGAKDYCGRTAVLNLRVPFIPRGYGQHVTMIDGVAPLCRRHANLLGERIARDMHHDARVRR